MKRLPFFILIVTSLFLVACAKGYSTEKLFHDSSNDYLKGQNGAGIVIPPNLSQKNISHAYYISGDRTQTSVSLLPPGSFAAKQTINKKGKKHGNF